jgi:transposase-like protein
MQKTQRTFTREFKVEAVQLAKSSNKPLAQIARDLGIADSTLHHWCKLISLARGAGISWKWTSDTRGVRKFVSSSAKMRSCGRSVTS